MKIEKHTSLFYAKKYMKINNNKTFLIKRYRVYKLYKYNYLVYYIFV